MKRLAILGPNGTYSSMAKDLLKNSYEAMLYPSIVQASLAVDDNTDGLLPFENTLDGFVMETLDSIIKNQFYIVEQVKLDVNFSFISNTEDFTKIKNVYVQFKAYGQCMNFITEHNLNPIILQSNMECYAMLQKNADEAFGAIVPIHADGSSFPHMIKNVADSKLDQTRFVRITKKKAFEKDIPLCCSAVIRPIQDSPGVLFDILEAFKMHNINLKTILSRPRRDGMGKYIFYIEFLLDMDYKNMLQALKYDLEKDKKNSFTVIGIYNRLEDEK